MLSALPLAIVALLLIDNPEAYRAPGNMTDLMAMMFSALALPWLVLAVFLQRSELRLQRKELTLQRTEIEKLVVATSKQAALMDHQLEISIKSNYILEYKAFLVAEEERITQLAQQLCEKMAALACEKLDVKRNDVQVNLQYSGNYIQAILTYESSGQELLQNVRYAEVAEFFITNPRLKRIHGFWKRCRAQGLGYWFRWELPHLVAPLGQLDIYKITALNSVGARARND